MIQKAQFNLVMDARQETDARVWEYAKQHDIAGLVDERRRRTKENHPVGWISVRGLQVGWLRGQNPQPYHPSSSRPDPTSRLYSAPRVRQDAPTCSHTSPRTDSQRASPGTPGTRPFPTTSPPLAQRLAGP
jgi:hypothetical protein